MGYYLLKGRVKNEFLTVREESEQWVSTCKS